MTQAGYNPKDKKSIIEYAKKLEGKSLREACGAAVENHQLSGKGNFGQVLEKFYFGYELNSSSSPDFHEVGMELKSSPLKQLQNQEYRAKERLVLNMINYINVINQNFEESDFYKKNACLLLIFYLHISNLNILDLSIKLVGEWQFPTTDLEIIKKDWEIINSKIKQGKAHELSEGDTFYLGACTKGANSKTERDQPNSNKKAKQRAYSFKQGYVNHIIASIANSRDGQYGKIISSIQIAKKQTIEDVVVSKFNIHYGKTIEQLVSDFNIKLNIHPKNFYASLTKAILGIELNKEIEEFEKAEIRVKVVRLKKNNLPEEDVSFPTFKFDEIINQDWEDSDFKDVLEHKFLFVFFQNSDIGLVLKRVKFWNMPTKDILEAEKVWLKTKDIISKGEIIKEIKPNRRITNFPNKKFSQVAHVRPHGRDSNDTYPLPINEKLTGAKEYTKQCFWLNNSYVRDEIFLK